METVNVIEICKEPGIADLPLRVRHPFGKAIAAERKGDDVTAAGWLEKALIADEELKKELKK